VSGYVKDDGLGLFAPKPIKPQHGYVRLIEPLREELRPEAHQDEHSRRSDRCNDSAEQFEGAGIGPVCVGKLDNNGCLACKPQDLPDQRRDCEIFLPRRCPIRRRDLTRRDRHQGGAGSNIGRGHGTGFGQRSSQLLQLDVWRISRLEMRVMLELVDDRIKWAICVVRRALIQDPHVRFRSDALQKDFANT
jgi:hypothetical protein